MIVYIFIFHLGWIGCIETEIQLMFFFLPITISYSNISNFWKPPAAETYAYKQSASTWDAAANVL